MWVFISREWEWQSSPKILAEPAEILWKPKRVRIKVDLPAPFGPSNPIALPLLETPRRQEIP